MFFKTLRYVAPEEALKVLQGVISLQELLEVAQAGESA